MLGCSEITVHCIRTHISTNKNHHSKFKLYAKNLNISINITQIQLFYDITIFRTKFSLIFDGLPHGVGGVF